MATLEKRVIDLEVKTLTDTYTGPKLYFFNDGEDAKEARLKAGIPADYKGKVIGIRFVESPHVNGEWHDITAKQTESA